MPKYLARLAEADLHPGMAVLRDVSTGDPYFQFPMSSALHLLGARKEAFYFITIHAGAYHLGEEVPVEDVPAATAKLYPPV